MTWIWSILVLILVGIIITCAVRCATDFNDGPGKIIAEKQDTQMEMAARLLNSNPTAAGKEVKK